MPSEPVGDDLAFASGMSSPPVVVRLAGLSAETLEALASPPCVKLLRARGALETDLAAVRASMVDIITEALTDFGAMTRRFLLAVKRDCFNGRNIRKHRDKAQWHDLTRVAPQEAERILALEEQFRDNDRTFAALYEQELNRERRHVLTFAEDRSFLRGIALGRPGLVRKIRSRAPSLTASDFSKRPTKWEQSLLRFVTRAAAKLSANSTLTTYALGSVQDVPTSTSLRFDRSPSREVSLVRINRPEAEQFQTMLLRHPAVRERALVAWNDSLEEIEPGRYRFLRAGHWGLEPGADRFHFSRPARITMNLDGRLLSAFRDALSEDPLRYDALLAALETHRDSSNGVTFSGEIRSDLDRLLDLGALILMPPWPTHEARLEQRIRQFLDILPDAATLRPTVHALDQLLALEDGFVAAPLPEHAMSGLKDAFSDLLDTTVHLADHEGALTTRAHFFEDVLVVPTVETGRDRGTVQIAESVAQELLHNAGLLSRFSSLFSHRHDVVHTLAAWWKEHAPTRREAPLEEVAQRFAPLWKEFLAFQKSADETTLSTFNPLQTPVIGALRELREQLISETRELLVTSTEGDVLPAREFLELLEALPRRYASLLGPAIFAQPMNVAGDTWVLNCLDEGTGRYLSRVIPVLEEPLRQRFLDHLISRSVVELEGEETDLLQVMHPWFNLQNAHPPQAERVLGLRGLHLGIPRDRRVDIGELVIRADLESETFRLVDATGRRLLPAHVSSMRDIALPPLLRFLLMFGPGETRGVFPFASSQGNDRLRSFNRLTCGNLVIRRRRWDIGIDSLRKRLRDRSDPEVYVAIHDWRHRLELPRMGYYFEYTYHGAFKPQYVDFSSPSLCRLFATSVLGTADARLSFQEALPSPAVFPFDGSRQRRACELLMDSLAIRTASGIPPFGSTEP